MIVGWIKRRPRQGANYISGRERGGSDYPNEHSSISKPISLVVVFLRLGPTEEVTVTIVLCSRNTVILKRRQSFMERIQPQSVHALFRCRNEWAKGLSDGPVSFCREHRKVIRQRETVNRSENTVRHRCSHRFAHISVVYFLVRVSDGFEILEELLEQ